MRIKTIVTALFLTAASGLQAQYIREVLEYTPAPGQFTNTWPWGSPASVESLTGGINGHVSLGGFGGYLVFRFNSAVENHPDNPFGVDFTLFGNAIPGWSEPAVVWVMKDDNENGLPDDTWHELAGSDRFFSLTRPAYSVTWTNPGGVTAQNIPWEDNHGNSGHLPANSFYTQNYYPLADSFPQIPADHYSLEGTLIRPKINLSNPAFLNVSSRAFGYADNHPRGDPPYTTPDNPYTPGVENSGGDAFDISWAIDTQGNYVDLDKVHFIKVQNATHHLVGSLAELSAEITGAVDIPPDPGLTGNTNLIVIRDLPDTLYGNSLSPETAVFLNGRFQSGTPLQWEMQPADAGTFQEGTFRFDQEGPYTLTASLVSHPETRTSVSLYVQPAGVNSRSYFSTTPLRVFPNPAVSRIRISANRPVSLHILDLHGRRVLSIPDHQPGESVNIESLDAGFYILIVKDEQGFSRTGFIKNNRF